MVKPVSSQQIQELEKELVTKMAAQGLTAEKLRLTLVGLADESC